MLPDGHSAGVMSKAQARHPFEEIVTERAETEQYRQATAEPGRLVDDFQLGGGTASVVGPVVWDFRPRSGKSVWVSIAITFGTPARAVNPPRSGLQTPQICARGHI